MNRARVQSILIDVIAYGHELSNPVMSRILENGCTNYIDMMTDEIIEAVEHGIELCKNISNDPNLWFKCSRCEIESSTEWLGSGYGTPNHCPNCGAKVVPND